MKNTIFDLRNMKANAWKEAKAFLDSHRREDGTMSAEDVKQYEKLEAKIVDIGAEITRLEKLNDYEAEMNKPTSKPIFTNPGYSTANLTGRYSHQYAEDFLNAFRTNFRSPSNVLQEGIDASGGYLVPDEFDKRLVQKLEQENIMRKLGTTFTTSGDHRINLVTSKPAAAWTAENATLTFGDATFAQRVLEAHKLAIGIKVSEELLYDSAFDLESFIIDAFARAIGNAEENAFLNGDGDGKPKGLFDPTYGGEVSVTTSASTIKADEIIDLVYSLDRAYRQSKSTAFIMNDQTLAQIRKLKDGNGQYLWQPSTQAGEPDRILGFPVYTSAFAPVAEAGKPVMAFGDLSMYQVADRGVRVFSELKEVFAVNDQRGFLARCRVDGLLLIPSAVKIMKMKA